MVVHTLHRLKCMPQYQMCIYLFLNVLNYIQNVMHVSSKALSTNTCLSELGFLYSNVPLCRQVEPLLSSPLRRVKVGWNKKKCWLMSCSESNFFTNTLICRKNNLKNQTRSSRTNFFFFFDSHNLKEVPGVLKK